MDVTQDAFENLVTQFSSELDFLRELVQNSMDAGSSLIDVWTEFHVNERAGAAGTIAIHVDDHGEGMDEDVIDAQLTTLFSSTKENDLTKIGKFGIGFVSVFAIRPRGVVVHTGRAGEYWEVFFHEDRSFSKTRLESPVEGTQVTVFVEGDAARYRELVVESRATLEHWCRHSDTEVTFEDRSAVAGPGPMTINEPFEVEGVCGVHHTLDDTEIVLAYRRPADWSFFNKGLTLAVVRDLDFVGGRFRHVAFKVKSRYLEHTLARETVIRDDNFHRAMQMVTAAADGELRGQLVSELRALAASTTWDLAAHGRYFARLDFLSHEDGFESFESVPLLRTVDGGVLSLEQAWEAARHDDRLFVSDAASPLTRALAGQGVPVMLSEAEPHGDAMQRLLARYLYDRLAHRGVGGALRRWLLGASLGERVAAMVGSPERLFVAVTEVEPTPELARLLAHTKALLGAAAERPKRGEPHRKRVPIGYDALVPVRLEGNPSGTPPLFLTGRRVEPLMALPPPGSLPSYHRRRPVAAINVDHPHLGSLVDLDRADPALGAYSLARSITLVEDRLLFEEVDLLTAARDLELANGFVAPASKGTRT